MIPEVILNALDSFNQREIQIMAESLKVIFDNSTTKFPFTDKNKMFGNGEWCRSDIFHYLVQIDFNVEHVVCMEIMAIISTIIISRQF